MTQNNYMYQDWQHAWPHSGHFKPLHKSATITWLDPGEQARYRQDLARIGPSWYWSSRSMQYTFNQQGFRAPEFDHVDWANSIICLGCSFMFGAGVDDSETIAARIAHYTGRPTVNLGVCGAGMDYAGDLLAIMLSKIARPWAVVVLWPGTSRTCHYGTNPEMLPRYNNGHNPETLRYWEECNRNGHAETAAWITVTRTRLLCKDTRYYHGTCNNAQEVDSTMSVLECETRTPTSEESRQQGHLWSRDLWHPGPKYLDQWARTASINLQQQGN